MADIAAAASDEARERSLEIQSELRSAAVGADEAAEQQQRIAIQESNASRRTGAEYAEAEAWAYDDSSTNVRPRR